VVADDDRRQELVAHYRSCFSSPSGSEVLRDLSAFTGDEHDLYSDNALDTAYRLGMRRVLLRIRALMKGVEG
jgi:hypothetical protein